LIQLTTKSVIRVDTAEVTRAVGAANARALNMAGGRLRKTARNSIPFRKRRTTLSQPGRPPNAHKKGKGIKTILYGYDRRTHTLVVGFAKLGGVEGQDVPKTLETGGKARIKVIPGGGPKSKPRHRKRNRGRVTKKRERSAAEKSRIKQYYQNKSAATVTKSVTIKSRPTMVPALDKTTPQLPQLWEGQVKATSLY
jgi:hypothetical protein